MNLLRVANLVSLLLMSSLVSAQEKVHWDMVSRIREESFERSQVLDYAWYLSDVIGPRLAGSATLGKAQVWAKAKMDEMGLTATALEPWGEKGVSWEQKHTSIHLLEPSYQPIIGYPVAFSPGTNGLITGKPEIVDIQSKEDLEEYRGKLRNAIVLAHPEKLINPRFTPDAVRHDEQSLAAYARTGTNINIKRRAKEPWWQLSRPKDLKEEELEEFFKSENVAIVLNPGRGGDGSVRVGGRRSFRNDMTVENIEKGVPALILIPEHYNRIYRLVKKGIPVQLEIEATVEISNEPTELVNVVGEIPGTDLAHEIVMIGGHLDSWHTATGASDNGAGVSVALEAMRILKAIGAAPRRTIRIALWDSEELGHKGSIGYVAKHFGNPRDGIKPEYDNFSVYFNVDNGAGQIRGVHLQGNEVVAPIFDEWMKPFHDLDIGTLSKFSNTGSDQVRFDRAGLPGFQFLQDRLAYWTRRWHYNMDFYDHIIPMDLKTNAAVLASFAYHAAMRDEKMPRKRFENWNPEFKLHQPDLFKDGKTLTNAFADFDNDGDLDLFVGFDGKPNRLYRNDKGMFKDVAAQVGLADSEVTRAAAWGDYNGDGHMDLFVAFVTRAKSSNKLYRNDGDGKHFTDVTKSTGVSLSGSFRQASWVDYDNDGDVDLYIGMRNKANVLFQNNNGKFKDVAKNLGIGDPRRTVGAAWFDYDKDGDLDCYVTNMDGDANGLFRNDGSKFVDV
ncbi:MAG: M20/M25/M40 family metallo-hydrolase, partial [Nitrospirales bacterium]